MYVGCIVGLGGGWAGDGNVGEVAKDPDKREEGRRRVLCVSLEVLDRL